ncbi:MAG: hypothetical protein JNL30_00420 [Rubrivivax sp.]|nr:hypothetical protein [Rubrivivax sp.]
MLLTVLLVLALPVKGVAAAGFMTCGSLGVGSHAMHAAAAAALGEPGHGTQAAPHQPGAHHGHGMQHSHGMHHAASDSDYGNSAEGSSSSCTQCAPCGVAVAPPLAMNGPASHGSPSALPAADTPAWAGVVVDLPDRPPRSAAA